MTRDEFTCGDTRPLLGAYVDAELDPDTAAKVAGHLANCPECSSEYESMLDTMARLRGGLRGFAAPDVLRERVRAELRRTTPARARRWSWRAAGIAAALLFVGLGAGGAVGAARGRREAIGSTIRHDVLASHVRSLMPGHLTDVASNDQHNVKPWFNGRVDFSPEVPRLEADSFPLVGGRVDYVAGRPAAVIVYARRKHVIDVFAWPDTTKPGAVRRESLNGYNMIEWGASGIRYWAVSDVNDRDLEAFAKVFRAAGTP